MRYEDYIWPFLSSGEVKTPSFVMVELVREKIVVAFGRL
jgi:hypothetical protein